MPVILLVPPIDTLPATSKLPLTDTLSSKIAEPAIVTVELSCVAPPTINAPETDTSFSNSPLPDARNVPLTDTPVPVVFNLIVLSLNYMFKKFR